MKSLLFLAAFVFTGPLGPLPKDTTPSLTRAHIATMRADGSLANVVNRLVQDGVVCEIRGHLWADGCSVGPGCTAYHTGPLRHCVVCRKEETRTLGPWQ
jgi:hypothetical protein